MCVCVCARARVHACAHAHAHVHMRVSTAGRGEAPMSPLSGPMLFLIAENQPMAVPQSCRARACQGSETDFRGGKKASPKDGSLPSCRVLWKIR